ncbi:MAG: IclR family transcriptional regulator [Clostridiales bacterium]|nr:IclR family transcriptional regulator [Clostridiales bacterium]
MSSNTVQSVDRAFEILETLAIEKDGLGVTEIGKRVGLHKSTVHRLLNSMAERGYIEQNQDTGAYRLGLKFIELCSLYLNHVELKTEAQPYLRNLSVLTGQPVHLATLIEGEAVYIDKIENYHNIRMYSSIGKRIPLHCTAVGKILLSDKNTSYIQEIFVKNELTSYTPNTLTDLNQILEEIGKVKRLGWAKDDEEHEVGIRCIAAPVYDYRRRIIAAVSTSGNKEIIYPDRDEEIARYVIRAASDISKRMGYTEDLT